MLEVMIVFWVATTGNSVKKNTLKASVTSIVELEGAELIQCNVDFNNTDMNLVLFGIEH